MIDSIAGEVVEVGADFAVVDTGGIAYRAFATATALRELTVGHEALLYTQLIVRDDSMQLFGFASRDEREIFGQLLTVGQVGPKLALQILSSLPLNDLIQDGSSLGIHLVLTCDTYGNVGRNLSRKAVGEFDKRVLFQMSPTDSASLIDSPAASRLGMYRALFYSEQEGYVEMYRPYALPDDSWLDGVARSFAGVR